MNNQYRPQRFTFLPPVIKNLLIINVLVFLSTFFVRGVFGVEINDVLGLRYFGSSAFKPYQFLTYMFSHASFQHLFFNMFALWMFGYLIENVMGSKRFLLYYILCGIGAAICHYAVAYFSIHPVASAIDYVVNNPSYDTITEFVANHKFRINAYSSPEIKELFTEFQTAFSSLQYNATDSSSIQTSINFLSEYRDYYLGLPNVVGASGAVFGILLAFGMLFPNLYIYLYFLFPIKAKWFVIGYGVIELISGITGRGGNVAHFAHLGGMIIGFIIIKIWMKKGVLSKYN